MTNSSPPDPQNPIPERRQRPASGVTFDEMIAIIVAFSTIGAILFWSIGSRNNRLARNFGLGNNLLGSDETIDTGLGIGNTLFGRSREDIGISPDLESENRRLAARVNELESPVAYIPPSRAKDLDLPARTRTYELDSGARLVPLNVDTLPALRNDTSGIRVIEEDAVEIQPEETIETEPEAIVPKETEPEVRTPKATTPEATTPKATTMPRDVTPSYWAYPFVRRIRERALIPELARNQNFEPDELITRATMATLISQAFRGLPLNENVKSFKDVTNKNAIAEDIDKAVRLGFMQGYSQKVFRPLENIPRYQVLVALATGLGLKPSGNANQILQQFGDSEGIPDWARQQVAAAIENGLLVNGPNVANNALMLEEPATRAEVTAMIHQALVKTGKLEPLKSKYIVNP